MSSGYLLLLLVSFVCFQSCVVLTCLLSLFRDPLGKAENGGTDVQLASAPCTSEVNAHSLADIAWPGEAIYLQPWRERRSGG